MDLFSGLDGLTESEGSRETIKRLPLPYPGSKFKDADKIIEILPRTGRYVEPFGGSAGVLIKRVPEKFEVYNDRYGGIVAFYRALRDNYEELVERLNTTIYSREEFIWCRDTWENTSDNVERAARWFYMTFNSFTCQGRNFARGIDVSLAKTLYNRLCDFHAVHKRLQNVVIENLDWYRCIRDYDDGATVFYLDPPYYKTHKVYKHNVDHEQMLDTVFDSKSFFAVSSYFNDLYNKYSWDDKIEWETRTTMDSPGLEGNNKCKQITQRKKATEILWIKDFE